MKLLRSLMLCLLLSGSFVSHSRDVDAKGKDFAGVWKGFLNVTMNGQPAKLPFDMKIEKGDYNQYGGHCVLYIRMTVSEEVYINCKISGSVSGEIFTFTDKKVIDYTLPRNADFYWCTKTGTLHFEQTSKGEDMLVGPVSGYSPNGNCMPATAELYREKK